LPARVTPPAGESAIECNTIAGIFMP